MDFDLPVPAAFRAEVRSWLAAHLTDDVVAAHRRGGHDDADFAVLRGWNGLLADAGLAGLSWPVEYGGRGLDAWHELVLEEELAAHDAPGPVNILGVANIGPALLEFGTPAQKARHLPGILRGTEIWCQGMSEPGAGSDLAALRTRAVRDGDHYVVTGQKTWNTLGHRAGFCQLFVRTDPDRARHRGVSCLLLDMRSPGVTVRPLVTAAGDHEFNEIFLDDVRVPGTALLGPENGGWAVAMATLSYERAGVAKLHLDARRRITALAAAAFRAVGPDGTKGHDDPVTRLRLADLDTRCEMLRLIGLSALAQAEDGGGAGAASSLAKIAWSDLEQDVARAAFDLLGPAALGEPWARDRLYSRSLSIVGGTTQINKNIVAERVIGLPRAR